MSSWVYDTYKKTFRTLYGSAVVKDGLTLEALLEALHQQDREPLYRFLLD